MPKEIIDLVNENDEVIGEVDKDEANQNPALIHREVAVVIFNRENEVLLQQRSRLKTHHPGKWTVAAAGHVGKGEDMKIAAQRELLEELGFSTSLNFIKKEFNQIPGKESRFTYIYYGFIEKDTKFILQKSEVEQVKWIKLDSLKDFSADPQNDVGDYSKKIIAEIGKIVFKNY